MARNENYKGGHVFTSLLHNCETRGKTQAASNIKGNAAPLPLRFKDSRERTHCGRLLHVAVKRHRSRLSLCPPFPGRSASAHLLVHPESNKETRAKTQQTSQTNPFFVH
ncbi:hypothetical protein OUZ56_001982 [Daphnia magna]|uniref:Uncharacterized protein n=1 Tax=Daphnia magna TaxID=35525 RepID=A0ABR0A4B8_9CRUS|nr:hypothetical protein OUZ56_001982 [Daphnia magna]